MKWEQLNGTTWRADVKWVFTLWVLEHRDWFIVQVTNKANEVLKQESVTKHNVSQPLEEAMRLAVISAKLVLIDTKDDLDSEGY